MVRDGSAPSRYVPSPKRVELCSVAPLVELSVRLHAIGAGDDPRRLHAPVPVAGQVQVLSPSVGEMVRRFLGTRRLRTGNETAGWFWESKMSGSGVLCVGTLDLK